MYLQDLKTFIANNMVIAELSFLQAFLIEREDGSIDLVGNRTEGALLILLRNWGRNYKNVRANHKDDVVQLYGFSSAKKMASVMIKTSSGLRLYNKVRQQASSSPSVLVTY